MHHDPVVKHRAPAAGAPSSGRRPRGGSAAPSNGGSNGTHVITEGVKSALAQIAAGLGRDWVGAEREWSLAKGHRRWVEARARVAYTWGRGVPLEVRTEAGVVVYCDPRYERSLADTEESS